MYAARFSGSLAVFTRASDGSLTFEEAFWEGAGQTAQSLGIEIFQSPMAISSRHTGLSQGAPVHIRNSEVTGTLARGGSMARPIFS